MTLEPPGGFARAYRGGEWHCLVGDPLHRRVRSKCGLRFAAVAAASHLPPGADVCRRCDPDRLARQVAAEAGERAGPGGA